MKILILISILACAAGLNAEVPKLIIPLGSMPNDGMLLVCRDQEIDVMPGVNPVRLWDVPNEINLYNPSVEISFSEQANGRFLVSTKLIIFHDDKVLIIGQAFFDLNPKVCASIGKNEFYVSLINDEIVVRCNGADNGGVIIIKKGSLNELKNNTVVSELSALWKWIPTEINFTLNDADGN